MSPKKLRFQIGDIIEITVLSKLAYLQYIAENEHFTSLLRVYTTLHDIRPATTESMVTGPSFYRFYALHAALREPGLVERVGNLPLSSIDDPLPTFKSRMVRDILGNLTVVHDIEEVQSKRKTYYFPGICGHDVLLHHILKLNGIDVPASAFAEPDPSEDADARFFLQFSRKRDALTVARACTIPDLRHKIERDGDGGGWHLVFYGDLPRSVDEIDAHLIELAATHDGTFDGHEIRVA